ncbi:MAG: PH domain-containing protein [Rickettsiales bacterium]|nr:PH domain-containing protein [Rickettsiales bacterium]
MPTLKEIKEQIKALPHKYIFYTTREIKYLPKILADNERVLALTSGYHGTSTVLLVCTNRRLLFVDKGMFFGIKVKQLNLDRVQSINSSYVLVFGSIQIWDGAASYEISMILKDSIDPFVKTVRNAIDQYRQLVYQDVAKAQAATREQMAQQHASQHTQANQPMPAQPQQQQPQPQAQPQAAPPPQPAMMQIDPVTQLEKLAKLRDQGHLTEQEFLMQKKRILNPEG